MKRHENKFEASSATKMPVLKNGAMIRKGQMDQAKSDGMSDESARHFREADKHIFPNPAAINWFYEDGELP